jgi:hypothetical protein
LSQEYPDTIIFANAIICHFALPITHEHIRTGSHGQLYQAQIFTTCSFMKK